MKGSLFTSSLLHTLALSAALVSLGSPEKLEFAPMESLPVDIVPIEEFTQIQKGATDAPLAETSAPVPTQRPPIAEPAENIGDNEVDLKSPPTPSKRPVEQEVAAAPKKVETPAPTPDPKANEVKEVVKEDTAPPPEPEPQPTEPQPVEQAVAEEIPLPEQAPIPAARPKPEIAKPAEKKPAPKPDAKKDTKAQETAKSKPQMESDFNADEVAALLNKTDAAGGGAKRSTDQAALGGRTDTGGSKLSQSELDALRGVIQDNWLITPGMADAADVRIRVTFRLDQNGALIGEPEATATGGSPSAQQVLMSGAVRAVRKSAPFTNLPPDKYDAWSEVVVNFDPSELM
ncbi:cell envelope integrity protein TolA [Allorhizobium sp. NPDC080224]|uniref:cell envelope integrity protein TolA n=1 Tax=Allorhizobium sp. NPDC080224 TaxID=3390547 RepID=UPI003D04A93D